MLDDPRFHPSKRARSSTQSGTHQVATRHCRCRLAALHNSGPTCAAWTAAVGMMGAPVSSATWVLLQCRRAVGMRSHSMNMLVEWRTPAPGARARFGAQS